MFAPGNRHINRPVNTGVPLVNACQNQLVNAPQDVFVKRHIASRHFLDIVQSMSVIGDFKMLFQRFAGYSNPFFQMYV
jgi:hypothetical protein